MSSIKNNFFYSVLLSVSQVLFPLLTFSYLSRVIQPEGIGLVSFAESICRYVILISAIGIPIYGIREVSRSLDDRRKLNNLFSQLIIIHFLLTIILLIIYFCLVLNVKKLYVNIDYYILGSLMIISNVFIVEWYFQGLNKFRYITIRTLILRAFILISVFLIIKNKNDTYLYFLLLVLTSVINSIINFTIALRDIKFVFYLNMRFVKYHIKPLLLIFSTTVFSTIYVLLDTIFLGFISNDSAVGLYSLSLKISKVPIFIIGSLSTVLIPVLSKKIADNDIVGFDRLIAKSIDFVIIFSFPAIILFLSISEELILVFAGKKFLSAAVTLKILSPLVLIISLIYVFGFQIITPFSKDKYLTYSVLFGSILSVLLNIYLIPLFNENGAAISNLVAELVVLIFTFYFARKLTSITLNLKFIFKNILLVLPIYFITILVKLITRTPLNVITLTFIFSFLYFIYYQIFILKSEIILDFKNYFFNYCKKIRNKSV